MGPIYFLSFVTTITRSLSIRAKLFSGRNREQDGTKTSLGDRKQHPNIWFAEVQRSDRFIVSSTNEVGTKLPTKNNRDANKERVLAIFHRRRHKKASRSLTELTPCCWHHKAIIIICSQNVSQNSSDSFEGPPERDPDQDTETTISSESTFDHTPFHHKSMEVSQAQKVQASAFTASSLQEIQHSWRRSLVRQELLPPAEFQGVDRLHSRRLLKKRPTRYQDSGIRPGSGPPNLYSGRYFDQDLPKLRRVELDCLWGVWPATSEMQRVYLATVEATPRKVVSARCEISILNQWSKYPFIYPTVDP